MQYRSFFFGLLQRGSPVEEAVDAEVAVVVEAVAVGPVAVALARPAVALARPAAALVRPAAVLVRPAAVLVHPAVARHGPTLIALRRLARPVRERDRAAADRVSPTGRHSCRAGGGPASVTALRARA